MRALVNAVSLANSVVAVTVQRLRCSLRLYDTLEHRIDLSSRQRQAAEAEKARQVSGYVVSKCNQSSSYHHENA